MKRQEMKMTLEKVLPQDLQQISGIISEEFPYTPFDFKSLVKKLKDERFHLMKIVENAELVAFIEIEMLGEETARVNGLAVKGEYKNKGFGERILKEAIEFLKNKGINIVTIFVRQDNKKAKELYKKVGFGFVGLFQDESTGTIIEEMVLELGEEKPGYVS